MKRALATIVLAVLPLSVVSVPAFARADEPSAIDAENALQAYKDGKTLRDKGDLAASLEKFRAAHALVETPITALELGRAYALMSRLIEAREVWLAVARMPMRKNESVRASEARGECERLAIDARPRLASIVVRVSPADAEAKVRVDGDVVPAAALIVPRLVNPGPHVVSVEANGETVRRDVKLAEGGNETVEIEAPKPKGLGPTAPVAVVAVVDPHPTSVVVSTPPPDDTPRKVAIYGGLGLAGVGAVVGTLTGVMTLAQASTLKEVCTADGRCPRAAESDLSAASSLGTVSTVAFGAAVVGGLVAAGAYFLWRPTTPRTATIVPVPGGVVGTF